MLSTQLLPERLFHQEPGGDWPRSRESENSIVSIAGDPSAKTRPQDDRRMQADVYLLASLLRISAIV